MLRDEAERVVAKRTFDDFAETSTGVALVSAFALPRLLEALPLGIALDEAEDIAKALPSGPDGPFTWPEIFEFWDNRRRPVVATDARDSPQRLGAGDGAVAAQADDDDDDARQQKQQQPDSASGSSRHTPTGIRSRKPSQVETSADPAMAAIAAAEAALREEQEEQARREEAERRAAATRADAEGRSNPYAHDFGPPQNEVDEHFAGLLMPGFKAAMHDVALEVWPAHPGCRCPACRKAKVRYGKAWDAEFASPEHRAGHTSWCVCRAARRRAAAAAADSRRCCAAQGAAASDA